MSDLTKEEFSEWLDHPVTKQYQQILLSLRKDLLEQWAAGNFTGSSAEETVQLNAKALGRIHQLEELMELEYDDIREVQSRLQTGWAPPDRLADPD